MMRWFLILAALLTTLLIALVVAAYLASPWLAERWVMTTLSELGFTSVSVDVERPGPNQLSVPALALTTEDYTVNARGVTLRYHWRELLAGRLTSASIDNLVAELVFASDPAGTGGETRALPPPINLWDLVPINRVEVTRVRLLIPALELEAEGSATFDENQLSVTSIISAAVLDEPITLAGSQSRAGHIRVRLSQADTAVIEASTTPDPSADRLMIEASARLEETPFKTLLNRLGGEASHGRLETTFTSSLPWPLQRLPGPTQIKANGHAIADYAAELDAATVTARFAGDFVFDGDALVLTPTPESRVRIAAATLDSVVRPVEMLARWNDERLETTFSGSMRLEQADDWSAEVTTTAPLTTHVELNTLDIDAPKIAATIDARLGEVSQRASMTGQGTLKGDVVSLKAQLILEQGFTLPLAAVHDLETSAGKLTIDQRFTVTEPLLASLLADWSETYDLDSGDLSVALQASWREDADLSVTGNVDIHDGLLNYDDYYLFEGMTASLDVRVTGTRVELAPSSVGVTRVDVGFPVTNISARVRASDSTVTATNVRGHLLGGTVEVGQIDYDITRAASQFTASVTGINLAQVLALEGDQLEGSGTLDGQLPVTISNNTVSMTGGTLEARPPGGSFRYTSAASIADAAGQPGVDFALRALDDFNYEHLGVGADYAADGTLTLNVRLEGHNPEVESGRSIHYNVTVTENIPALLTSLRLADGVTEGIQKRLIQ